MYRRSAIKRQSEATKLLCEAGYEYRRHPNGSEQCAACDLNQAKAVVGNRERCAPCSPDYISATPRAATQCVLRVEKLLFLIGGFTVVVVILVFILVFINHIMKNRYARVKEVVEFMTDRIVSVFSRKPTQSVASPPAARSSEIVLEPWADGEEGADDNKSGHQRDEDYSVKEVGVDDEQRRDEVHWVDENQKVPVFNEPLKFHDKNENQKEKDEVESRKSYSIESRERSKIYSGESVKSSKSYSGEIIGEVSDEEDAGFENTPVSGNYHMDRNRNTYLVELPSDTRLDKP